MKTEIGVILYHIPSATAAPLPVRLISRLKESLPKTIQGVKELGKRLALHRSAS